MRLAALMHRTVEELDETMSVEEYHRWIAFQHHYDLPDSFMTVGVLASLMSRFMGGKQGRADFAPYYGSDRKAHADASMRRFAEAAKLFGGRKKNDGKQAGEPR